MGTQNNTELRTVDITKLDIRNMIYVIHGQQVMLDSDLAMLYQVETGALNRAVKRNLNRFPEDFCFQLTTEEYENLRCQFGISSFAENGHGGRRFSPYVFTEQGIAMLASVLRSDVAVNVSIEIMRTFTEMRRFMSGNAIMFERISAVECKQFQYQQQTDEKLQQIFAYISEHEESSQKVFFDGQIYDAFSLLISLIQKAKREIVLIDGYVDVDTLNLLCKKKDQVHVQIYTYKETKLLRADISKFNAEYPTLEVKFTNAFHDRFLILDSNTTYHIGASVKDAGKKCFAISLLQDKETTKDILKRLQSETKS